MGSAANEEETYLHFFLAVSPRPLRPATLGPNTQKKKFSEKYNKPGERLVKLLVARLMVVTSSRLGQ